MDRTRMSFLPHCGIMLLTDVLGILLHLLGYLPRVTQYSRMVQG